MQFERLGAVSCELWSLRFALSVVVGCIACFCLVWCSGSLVLLLLGAEPSQYRNNIGDAGASSLGEGLKWGAKDTTLHVRVPGKPVETIGLDCVTTVVFVPLCSQLYIIPLPVSSSA